MLMGPCLGLARCLDRFQISLAYEVRPKHGPGYTFCSTEYPNEKHPVLSSPLDVEETVNSSGWSTDPAGLLQDSGVGVGVELSWPLELLDGSA